MRMPLATQANYSQSVPEFNFYEKYFHHSITSPSRPLAHLPDPRPSTHQSPPDGFDPWACQHAEFVDSYYSGGDDCVAVKSGIDRNATAAGAWPCGSRYAAANISVNNVTCDGSHGLTIGSEMSGGVDGVRFTNIRIRNSGPSVSVGRRSGHISPHRAHKLLLCTHLSLTRALMNK